MNVEVGTNKANREVQFLTSFYIVGAVNVVYMCILRKYTVNLWNRYNLKMSGPSHEGRYILVT